MSAERKPKWRRKQPEIAAYFTTSSGERFRLYDTQFHAGRYRVLPLGAGQATARVFVAEDGAKRSYTFRPGDRRILDAEELRRQLSEAAYVGKKVDTKGLTPW